MMTQAIRGRTLAEAEALIHHFKHMMSIEDHHHDEPGEAPALGDLEALQGVVKFPVRIKCAVLAWNTLSQVLESA